MEKINWKQKLTSRKFWAAVVSFVALLVVALGGTQAQATQITALIMAGATVVAYIVGEGMIDAASAGAPTNTINNNFSGDTTVTQPTTGKRATTPPSAPAVDKVDPAAAAINDVETSTAQAAVATVSGQPRAAAQVQTTAPSTNGAA